MIDNNDVYKKAIEKFGIDNQIIKAIEELSELQKELCKISLSYPIRENDKNIHEEIADVEIMLDQLKIIFDCHAIIETVKKQKIERLKGLLDD